MQIVIDIPEEIYEEIKTTKSIYRTGAKVLCNAIVNGTPLPPLPKGHGRLVDANELIKSMDSWDKFGYSAQYGLERLCKDDKEYVPYVHYEDMVTAITNVPTIIEEDKE